MCSVWLSCARTPAGTWPNENQDDNPTTTASAVRSPARKKQNPNAPVAGEYMAQIAKVCGRASGVRPCRSPPAQL